MHTMEAECCKCEAWLSNTHSRNRIFHTTASPSRAPAAGSPHAVLPKRRASSMATQYKMNESGCFTGKCFHGFDPPPPRHTLQRAAGARLDHLQRLMSVMSWPTWRWGVVALFGPGNAPGVPTFRNSVPGRAREVPTPPI